VVVFVVMVVSVVVVHMNVEMCVVVWLCGCVQGGCLVVSCCGVM
jgi:hypothetical protein